MSHATHELDCPPGRPTPVLVWLLAALVLGGARPAAAQDHGIAMHGDLKYEAGFGHLDYVTPLCGVVVDAWWEDPDKAKINR